MSKKLKIILGVLLLVAGFLVVRVGSSFYRSAKTAALISQTITTSIPEENFLTLDSDKDGVSDYDEIIYATDPFNRDSDGDGYLDGEEIASGYDPLDPFQQGKGAENFYRSAATANLTDRLLTTGIASIINNSGELDPEQMTPTKFADILQSISNEAVLSLNPMPLTDSDIRIIEDNDPESIKKYLSTISLILEEGLFSSPAKVAAGDINSILGISSEYLNYFEDKYNSLKIIEVPSSWKEIHKQTLFNLKSLSNSVGALSDKAIDDDPVKASFALTQLQQSFLALNDLLNEASRLAKSQNISIQDSILDMLQMAKNPLFQR